MASAQTNPAKPRLLIIHKGNLNHTRFMLESLRRLGYHISLISCYPEDSELDLVDETFVFDYSRADLILERIGQVHEELPFDGVFTFDELMVPLANRIAQSLGMPPISTHFADAFRYKDRMRIAWECCGVPVPRYRIVTGDTALTDITGFTFPVIVKPAGFLASIGVVKAETPEELGTCLEQAAAADRDIPSGGAIVSVRSISPMGTNLLVEELIQGEEYSAEGFVKDGTYHLVGVTKKFVSSGKYSNELAHIHPALPFDDPDYVLDVLEKAHGALGLCNAWTHTEFRMTPEGVCVPIELGARPAGGMILELVHLSRGVDPIAIAAAIAVGGELPEYDHAPGRYAGVVFPSAPEESFGKCLQSIVVDAPEGATVVEESMYYGPADVISAPKHTGVVRLGHVLFVCDDYDTAARFVAEADSRLKMEFA